MLERSKALKKVFGVVLAVALVFSLNLVAVSTVGRGEAAEASPATTQTTLYYGDFTLDGSWNWLPGIWDLTQGEVVIEYTADLTGAPNVAYTGDYGQAAYVGFFNKANFSGALMSGFLADGDNPDTEFPSYPDKDGIQDLDDKFNAQRFPNPGTYSELMYDVLCSTNAVQSSAIGSYDNYGIWFDRDGVDQWQDDAWGAVDNGTYNTEGTYPVKLRYRIASNQPGTGTMCPTHAPGEPRTNDPAGGFGVPTGFDRQSDGSYADYPAGISWTPSDPTELSQMQGLVFGNVGNGTIVVENVRITGYLVLQTGTATGGGWFIAEDTGGLGNVTPGGKATFGFVAKQKHDTSSGETVFQYKTDNLTLKSTSYDWVNIANSQALFEGTGRVNGVDGYKFRVRAVDGNKTGTDVDRFEIRIWTGTDGFDSPTHRAEGDLGGGQIVVHKK